jgi:hypothetical protein
VQKAEFFHASGRVLQIGPARPGFCAENLTRVSLSEVLSWPLADQTFDEIYFFAPKLKSSSTPRSLLVREGNELLRKIEEQFPELNQIAYSDREIDLFFQSPKSFSTPAQYIQFFHQLEAQKQISPAQRIAAIVRLEKEGLIQPADLKNHLSDQPLCAKEEVFSLFKEAVRRCKKRGARFHAYFPGVDSLHEVDECFEEIFANPWIEYSEEFSLESQTLKSTILYL